VESAHQFVVVCRVSGILATHTGRVLQPNGASKTEGLHTRFQHPSVTGVSANTGSTATSCAVLPVLAASYFLSNGAAAPEGATLQRATLDFPAGLCVHKLTVEDAPEQLRRAARVERLMR
jgi:hypothetical protein